MTYHQISRRQADLQEAREHDDHPLVEKLEAELAELEAHAAALAEAAPKLAELERERDQAKADLAAARQAVLAGTRDAAVAVERERAVAVHFARFRAISAEIAPIKAVVDRHRGPVEHGGADKGRLAAFAAAQGLASAVRPGGAADKDGRPARRTEVAQHHARESGQRVWKADELVWFAFAERQVLRDAHKDDRELLAELFDLRRRAIAEGTRHRQFLAQRALEQAGA